MKSPSVILCCLCLLCACATNRPDHFYVLSTQPQGPGEPRKSPAIQATLKVTLPSLVDRSELVLNTSADGVTVLEHERWAAPLADLLTQTLARDIERRRVDMLVSVPGASRPASVDLKLAIDIVQWTVHRGGQASIEAHWRIIDAHSGRETVGAEVFSAAAASNGYADIASALSGSVAMLADRVVAQLPHSD
jgi:hypothetical protein